MGTGTRVHDGGVGRVEVSPGTSAQRSSSWLRTSSRSGRKRSPTCQDTPSSPAFAGPLMSNPCEPCAIHVQSQASLRGGAGKQRLASYRVKKAFDLHECLDLFPGPATDYCCCKPPLNCLLERGSHLVAHESSKRGNGRKGSQRRPIASPGQKSFDCGSAEVSRPLRIPDNWGERAVVVKKEHWSAPADNLRARHIALRSGIESSASK